MWLIIDKTSKELVAIESARPPAWNFKNHVFAEVESTAGYRCRSFGENGWTSGTKFDPLPTESAVDSLATKYKEKTITTMKAAEIADVVQALAIKAGLADKAGKLK